MPSSSPPFRSLLSIVPPELEAIDDAWNDEAPTRPGDVSDRVTQVPSVPSELLAKRLMQEVGSDPPEETYEDGSDVHARPALIPEEFDPTAHGESRGSDSSRPTNKRHSIASALTPGSSFYGSAPAPRILESDGAPANRANPSGLELFDVGVHEAPTQIVPPQADELELDLSLQGSEAVLHLAEEAALLPLRSGRELAERFSSIPARPTDPLRDMRDRHAMGDFSGALEVAEKILATQPDQEEAFRCAQSCRDVLTDMYASRLGGTHHRAVITMSPDQIRWLSLDHRAGFLLSIIDGVSTIDELLDICGMPRLEALRILCHLLDQQAVSLET